MMKKKKIKEYLVGQTHKFGKVDGVLNPVLHVKQAVRLLQVAQDASQYLH